MALYLTIDAELADIRSEMEELPIDFDERLWNAMVDQLTVYNDERLVFHFKSGADVMVQL